MDEFVPCGLVPAYDMLHVSVAAGAQAILGPHRPNSMIEGTRACWKIKPHDAFAHIILATWQTASAWLHDSTDAGEVRAAADLYFLMRGRPGEDFLPACDRLIGALGRWGTSAFDVQYTDGGHRYYKIASNDILVRALGQTGREYPSTHAFANAMTANLSVIRAVVDAEHETHEDWCQQRLVG